MRYDLSRSVLGSSGIDFARQLAERNAETQPSKKFRSSAAPKGSKLPSGYRDRTQDRTSTETDDKASRVQALEEMMKLGQVDRATFERLRDEIVGGDIETTHLVKGLDFKLLERVKKGEDVLTAESKGTNKEQTEEICDEDLEEEFDRLESRDIAPVVKEKVSKRGQMAPPPPVVASVAGKKRSRDEILAELKASRKTAKAQALPAESALGPKFRKFGEKRETSRIERDDRGREVLITVDEEGRVKRKVKKPKTNGGASNVARGADLPMPHKGLQPLGMEVPESLRGRDQEGDEEEGDIFEDAGSDYDPLGGLDEEDESSEEERGKKGPEPAAKEQVDEANSPGIPATSGENTASPSRLLSEGAVAPSTTKIAISTAPRNYFSTPSDVQSSAPSNPVKPLTDPTILAALRKASKLNPVATSNGDLETTDDEETRIARRRQELLSTRDRDAEDLDMGFGSSRFEDEDMDDRKVTLSVWGREEDGGDVGAGGGKKRKRGPKKKKGDVNSAADVLKAMERRKGERA